MARFILAILCCFSCLFAGCAMGELPYEKRTLSLDTVVSILLIGYIAIPVLIFMTLRALLAIRLRLPLSLALSLTSLACVPTLLIFFGAVVRWLNPTGPGGMAGVILIFFALVYKPLLWFAGLTGLFAIFVLGKRLIAKLRG